ncbi:rRNA maturation RNase YbeY [Patescibacteria group bacterium]
MIRINVSKISNCPVSSVSLKRRLKIFLEAEGIVSTAELSIALIGEKEMIEIGKKYLGEGSIHNVLSFVPDEVKDKFVYPNDGIIHLGEIMVCYPLAYKQAKKENKLIEDVVYELVEHGARHLLGQHHN